jgi:hypothetical protein
MANLSSRTGLTPVDTTIALANNTATTIQSFAAYDAQELIGHVFVDATTDYRAAVKVTVVKNGAGTYEVAASDVAGDDISGSPIVTFAMSGSNLQATLPDFTGFASASIKYHLVSPVTNANYPLTVNASQVQGRIDGAAVTAGYIGEVVEQSGDISYTCTTSEADVTNSSIVLTPGVWMLCYSVSARYTTGTSSANSGFTQVVITNSANTRINNSQRIVYGITRAAATYTNITSLACTTVVNISSSTTYKLRAKRVDENGTGTGSINNNSDNGSSFYAVRIA